MPPLHCPPRVHFSLKGQVAGKGAAHQLHQVRCGDANTQAGAHLPAEQRKEARPRAQALLASSANCVCAAD